MSSDLFLFDESLVSDPSSPFNDNSVPIDNIVHKIFPLTTLFPSCPSEIEQIASSLFSSPSHQMGNLSLCQNTHLENASNSANGYEKFSVLEVKAEESQIPFCSAFEHSNSFVPSYGGCENAANMTQGSFSSLLFQPRFDGLMESPPNFHSQLLSSPENSSSSGQMRRACSTGDLHRIKTSRMRKKLSSSTLGTESSFIVEANSKVGKYSAEERKERIQRYRAKRGLRNFNKIIKYACRKTMADNRARIRGRFVGKDEAVEVPKTATSNRFEEEDDLWIEGFNEERSTLFNSYDPTQFQYYAYHQ